MVRNPNSILRSFFDPGRSILLYIIGTAALTLVLQASYDYVNDPGSIKGGFWLAMVALCVVVFIIIGMMLVKPRPIYVNISDDLKPQKQLALVLLVSSHKAASEDIINYHLPILHHCWLIATAESLGVANELQKEYKSKIAHIYVGKEYLVEPFDLHSTFELMDRILTEDIKTLDPRPRQVTLDITGGTKVMTAGMVLAGFANQALMEYTQTARDEKGDIKEGAVPQPTLIEAYFESGVRRVKTSK